MFAKVEYLLKRAAVTCFAVVLLCATWACKGEQNGQLQYLHYESIPQEGWWRSDTLRFTTDTIRTAGNYVRSLHFRCAKAEKYPFRDVYFEVTQCVLPDSLEKTDTLHCYIYDERGALQGNGMAHHQFDVVIDTVRLQPGEVVVASVRHCMYKNPLPGMIDIGFSCTDLSRE